MIRDLIDGFPVDKDWQRDRKATLEQLVASSAPLESRPGFALDGPLLVDDVDDPRWGRLDRGRLTTDERAYDEALVPFLADLARTDPHVARGLGIPYRRAVLSRAGPHASRGGCSTGRDRRCLRTFASACPESPRSRW